MATFRESFPIIYVADLDAALTFYRDLLGFAETYRFGDFVGLTGLALARVTEGQTGAHGESIALRGGRQFEFCVYTDDVDAAIGELRARGVPVLLEPADQPWGERMAYVADPDGHPVMICR